MINCILNLKNVVIKHIGPLLAIGIDWFFFIKSIKNYKNSHKSVQINEKHN